MTASVVATEHAARGPVTAPRLLRRTRATLLTTAAGAAVLWAAATAAVSYALLGEFLPARTASTLGAIATAAVAGYVAWRWRWAASATHVALWIEERVPELQYVLVTALEPRYAGLRGELNQRMAAVSPVAPLRRAAVRWLLPAAVAGAAGLAVALLLPRAAVAERLAGGGGSRRLPPPLAAIAVRIEPPAYSGHRAQELHDPETIRALVGSRVVVSGSGGAAEVTAQLGEQPLSVAEGWRTTLVVPTVPRALRLRHEPSGTERVLVLDPQPDDPPRLVLTLPARDTLLRTPPRSVTIAADVSDDIGLAHAAIEYMISSGQEETYTARTGRVAERTLNGARRARLSGRLSTADLRLGPGDVLSIRAVARDRNDVTGPGISSSETRTIRIARRDEYDSLAIEAIAPVFGDSALLSQREILQRTEALVRVATSLEPDTLRRRIAALAFDQERLRDRVHSLVFPGHEHSAESDLAGEPPDHAEPADPVNADLKVAYEAMWEAVRELRIAAPAPAIPPMRVAVEALDRARTANRVYLRGGTPRVLLDIESVRLTGSERGQSTGRAPRPAADTVLQALRARVAALAVDEHRSREQRLNQINELRVELLRVSARAAAALERAAMALRSGRDPRAEIGSAAGELAGAPVVREPAPPWSGW